MSLLSVTVKKARYVGVQASQLNTYVTLKLQNVKSTTVTVKGATPSWEQDFLFETNNVNAGLLIEVWSKGMIWDKALGYNWLPLHLVHYSNEENNGQWYSLDAELVMRDGEVVATKEPTGHAILLDCRFEIPFGRYIPPTGWQMLLKEAKQTREQDTGGVGGQADGHNATDPPLDPENTEAADLQRKLEMLNNVMDQEQRAEQARRQMQYYGHSGYSEDSDYTSDLNYPVGQHANSSASQFRSAAHQLPTPHRSFETSRENSYERDDVPGVQQPPPASIHMNHLSPGYPYHRQPHGMPATVPQQRYDEYGQYSTVTGEHMDKAYANTNDYESEPLFYNSRPKSQEQASGRGKKYNWNAEDSQESWYGSCYDEANYPSYQEPTDFYQPNDTTARKGVRRSNLERQTTLYDDQYYGTDTGYYTTAGTTSDTDHIVPKTKTSDSFEEYYDAKVYQDEHYGPDDEDRQWDSGGTGPYTGTYHRQTKTAQKLLPCVPGTTARKVLPQVPTASRRGSKILEHLRPGSTYGTSSAFDDETYPGEYQPSFAATRRKQMVGYRRSSSRQSSYEDRNDMGYNTPEISAHSRGASLPPTPRGASLPPTPTATHKLLPTVPTRRSGRASASLPPTPAGARKLPQPNRSAKSGGSNASIRRNNLLKRTSSAEEYGAENETDYSYYTRPGAISVRDSYSEDYYNYAYQSSDNLPGTEPLADGSYKPYEALRTTSRALPQPPKHVYDNNQRLRDEYNYHAETSDESVTTIIPNYHVKDTESVVTSMYTDYGSQGVTTTSYASSNYSSYMANTYTSQLDSKLGSNVGLGGVEMRSGVGVTKPVTNDAAPTKDTIESAVSSLGSFMKKGFGDLLQSSQQVFSAMESTVTQKSATTTATTTTTTQQSYWDQTDSTAPQQQAIYQSTQGQVVMNGTTVTSTSSYAAQNYVDTANNAQNLRGQPWRQDTILDTDDYLPIQNDIYDQNYTMQKQQSLNQDDYTAYDIHINSGATKMDTDDLSFLNKDRPGQKQFLRQQDSIESYSEDIIVNGGIDEYGKSLNQESPVSVIHVDNKYEPMVADDRYQANLVDSFQQAQSVVTTNNQMLQRQDSLLSTAGPAGSRRTSTDFYNDVSRKSSLANDINHVSQSRKSSVMETLPSYPQPLVPHHYGVTGDLQDQLMMPTDSIQEDDETVEDHVDDDILQEDVEKRVSFEEEAQVERREVTAKQRWLWAYNKIIMQMNVPRDDPIVKQRHQH